MERISTDDGGFIPVVYSGFADVFSRAKAETLAPHRSIDNAIDLEPGFKLPYGPIYTLSEFELRTLKAYIETNLANGFIQRSSSSAAAPILFAKKKEWRTTHLCGLLGSQSGDNQEPVPPTSDLGNARQTTRSSDFDQTGPPERLSSDQNQRRRRVQNRIPNPVQPIQIPSYALWLDECTCNL